MATQTFYLGPDHRFEASERIRFNGVNGILWIDRRLATGGWMHCGKMFQPLAATRREVVEAFGCADHRDTHTGAGT